MLKLITSCALSGKKSLLQSGLNGRDKSCPNLLFTIFSIVTMF